MKENVSGCCFLNTVYGWNVFFSVILIVKILKPFVAISVVFKLHSYSIQIIIIICYFLHC